MPEEFEDRDLAESVFWGVNLQRSLFRDTDLSGSTFFHVFMNDVSIDGEIDRLVVNGVDVTDYVMEQLVAASEPSLARVGRRTRRRMGGAAFRVGGTAGTHRFGRSDGGGRVGERRMVVDRDLAPSDLRHGQVVRTSDPRRNIVQPDWSSQSLVAVGRVAGPRA